MNFDYRFPSPTSPRAGGVTSYISCFKYQQGKLVSMSRRPQSSSSDLSPNALLSVERINRIHFTVQALRIQRTPCTSDKMLNLFCLPPVEKTALERSFLRGGGEEQIVAGLFRFLETEAGLIGDIGTWDVGEINGVVCG